MDRKVRVAEKQSETDHGPAYYSDFRLKIALRIVIVSLAPLMLVTGIILYQFHVYANQMVHAHLDELVLRHRQKSMTFSSKNLVISAICPKVTRLPSSRIKPFFNKDCGRFRQITAMCLLI